MRADVLTANITIRPSYANAETVKQEIEDSLLWLSEDHHGIHIEWTRRMTVDDAAYAGFPNDDDEGDVDH